MTALTYLQFHAVLIIPPLALLALATWRRDTAWSDTQSLIGLVGMVILALVYTIPWDGYLISLGVWSYPAEAITGRIWVIPYGEYLFFVLQSALTALWLYQFIEVKDIPLSIPRRTRLLGAIGGLAVSAAGLGLLYTGSGFYLGAILAWAGPVLAIQWGFGWPYLVRTWRQCLLGIGVPTLYLWVLDWLAITRWGLWTLDPARLTGIAVAGLPIEEMTFFLVTNVFLVQGLVMWMWLLDQLGRLRHSTEYVPRPTRFSSTE